MEYQNWKFELESDNFTNDSKDEKYQKIIEKVEEGATSVAYKEKKNCLQNPSLKQKTKKKKIERKSKISKNFLFYLYKWKCLKLYDS